MRFISIHMRGLAALFGVALIIVATTPFVAFGQSGDGTLTGMPVDELKREYVACERGATLGQLDTGDIMRCSVIYEDLKRLAFGGDFKKLKAWWDANAESFTNTGTNTSSTVSRPRSGSIAATQS